MVDRAATFRAMSTGSDTSSNSLQYVQARLQRRIGTMCAMYGCEVETNAEPIDANSRYLRVTAFQRRFALIEPVTTLQRGQKA